MQYKVAELARLAGVSTRTLRYYDQIGLLRPERTESTGYRLYGQAQVDLLQQILFYRELGLGLQEIKRMVSAPDFDCAKALERHLSTLQNKREHLERLIATVKRTIRSQQEGIEMSDEEKFESFKQRMIEENESAYGGELRGAFGDDAIDAAAAKLRDMSREGWTQADELSARISEALKEGFALGDPASAPAQLACDLHRQWLCIFWKDGTYSKPAHLALAEGYVTDPRFTAYYDQIAPGCTPFFRDAIAIYCAQ